MIPATLCFGLGILADRTWDLNGIAVLVTGLACWAIWYATNVYSRKHFKTACCFLYLMIICSGGLWHHARWNWFPENEIRMFASDEFESCVIRGVLATEPVRVAAAAWNPTLDTMKPKPRVRFRLRVRSIRDQQQPREVSGNVSVSLFLTDEQATGRAEVSLPQCGDEVELIGSLIGSRPRSNPGEFDFESHFRAKAQLASIFVDSTDAVKQLNPSKDVGPGMRAKLRANIDQTLHQHLPSNHAAFASAVLLGNRDQMDMETRNRFLKTGTSHLLAISGLHVGILASGFLLLLRLGFISRRNCLLLTIVFVISYAWLVEFRPTVLRASILICVMCGARLLGRSALSWGSLTTALMIVLIVNPADLFSLGTQLSFLAISSIIIGKPWIFRAPSQDPVIQLIARSRPTPVRLMHRMAREIRSAFCVSFLIWVMAIPLVAWRFHSIALIAPLLNPLLLLPMALGLYFGLATVACATIVPSGTFVPATICSLSLGCIGTLIDLGADQPAGHFWASGPSGYSVAVFYMGVALFAVFPHTKLPARWCIVLAAAWLVFGWLVPARVAKLQRLENQNLEVTLIDVRHGSAALLQLPDGRNILCDCGSLSGSYRAANTISKVLWRNGISQLDTVIVSHADVDHFNALPELLERFSVNSVWISNMMSDDDAPSVTTLRQALEQDKVPVVCIDGGSCIAMDESDQGSELSIQFLGPPAISTASLDSFSDNALSLVMNIKWKGRSVLLPGDVEEIGLESLLREPIDRVDVLIAAHHGSKNSDPQRFARWCKPTIVIASCGDDRVGEKEKQMFRNGHPCKVLTTDELGAIRCVIDGNGGLKIDRWESDGWQTIGRL